MSTTRDSKEYADFIVGYIRGYTQPAQWVGWSLAAGEPAARQALESALYDPETDALRDLTEPAVREGVILAVLASESLRKIVGVEADAIFEAAAERASRASGGTA